MRILFTAIALALSLQTASAQEQGAIAFGMTEGVSTAVRLNSRDGTIVFLSSGPAPPLSSEEVQIASLLSANVPSAPTQEVMRFVMGTSGPQIQRDAVRATLRKTPEGHMLLSIENGYEQGVTYRAMILRGDRRTPTDVCLVRPGGRGYEHWPYAFDAIEISALRLQDWKDGDPIPCM